MSKWYLSAVVGLTLSASATQTDEIIEIKGFTSDKILGVKAHQTNS